MIRFVVGPDNIIQADVLGKLPGRGIWVCAERSALEAAATKRLFGRAAKTAVEVPQSLVDDVEAALLRRVVDRVAMARKAAAAVAGYEKVKGWLETGRAAILLQANDGSERGRSRLRPPGGRGSFFDVLTASELGLSFGREHVIHAALAAGGLADAFREDALRLSGVRDRGVGDGSGRDAVGKAKKTQ